jgi:hypothetical protein
MRKVIVYEELQEERYNHCFRNVNGRNSLSLYKNFNIISQSTITCHTLSLCLRISYRYF